MSRKLKIKVVAGSLSDSALIRAWEVIAHRHDVELLAQEGSTAGLATRLPVIFFPSIPEMPNFFRDLDRHVAGADVIVGLDSSKLYTFQSLRASRNLGIPFVCVSHDYSPFVYEKFPNIRAIQRDVFENASFFFATSRKSVQLLNIENVSDARIQKINAVTDHEQFKFCARGAAKFKKYIGLPDSSILVTMKLPLSDLDQPLMMAQGIRLALNRIPREVADRLYILICGQGDASDKLKYEISDLGLGTKVMFLAQDPTPFLKDLLSATDVLIEGRQGHGQVYEHLPWHVISAAYAGVRLIVPSGTIADDWLSGQMIMRIDDFSPIGIAQGLTTVLKDLDGDASRRLLIGEVVSQSLSVCRAAEVMQEKLEVICASDERSSRRSSLVKFVEQHQVPVSYKEARDVLVVCEEVRDFSANCELQLYSEVLRIRGDALAALSRGDEAISAFEDSLKFNGSNHQALRGLGYLAWHGHSHEDALSFFKRGLAVNPNDYQCLMGVGLVYRRLKMFSEAVFWLQKAIAVGGLESPSLSLLVQACLENSDSPEALAALNEIRDVMGEHPNLDTAIHKLESHQ